MPRLLALTSRPIVAPLCHAPSEPDLASNADATKSVGIQVKTSQTLKPSWLLNEKVEQSIGGALAEPYPAERSTSQNSSIPPKGVNRLKMECLHAHGLA